MQSLFPSPQSQEEPPPEGETPPEDAAPDVQAELPDIDREKIAEALEPSRLRALAGDSWDWLQANVLTLDTALQAALVAASILGAVLIYRLLLRGLEVLKSREDTPPAVRKTAIWLRPLTWPLLLLIFFAVSEIALNAVAQPAFLPRVAVSLTLAWIVIRLASSVIREPFWARTLAFIAWSVAALSIFGLLEPLSAILDSVSVTLGETRLSPLTIVRGLIIAVIFFWVAIWLSSLLKNRIDRLPSLTPSVRILLSRAMQLLLITTAILIALSSIGFPLTALAVFSGAVGLGIGFGLQQIFSNLVSGVILLLDRSIKPGDVIQVDDTYGYVKSLGLRYASVVTRDNHEHLIPNEEFIVNKVVNWSFSDRAVRIKKEVGVAYDCDIRLARQLMLDAAASVERVLTHPKPACNLSEFGDSAIVLEIRFWISDPQNGVRNVTSDVLFAVWDAFQENGIGIPFPQQDLHIKSAEPGVFTIAQGEPPPAPARREMSEKDIAPPAGDDGAARTGESR